MGFNWSDPLDRRLLFATSAAAFALFAMTISYDLVWDDNYLLTTIRELKNLGQVVTSEFFLEKSTGYYRPVVLLSLWLDNLIGKGSPLIFHLTNVTLHAAVSGLAFAFLRLFVSSWPAFAAALLFALSPVRVESVAFVAGRTDVVAALFLLPSFVLFAGEAAPEKPGFGRGAWLSLLFLFLACLSKEVAYVAPAAFAMWFALSPNRSMERMKRLAPWLLGWAAVLVLVFIIRGPVLGIPDYKTLNFSGFDPTARIGMLFTYLRLSVLPWPLNSSYTPDQIQPNLVSALGALVFLASLYGAWRFGGRSKSLSGLTWFLLFLVPVALPLPLTLPGTVSERYLYIPALGTALLFALLFCALRERSQRAFALVSALLICTSAVASLFRSAVWKDESAIFTAMVAESPRTALAHNNLGAILLNAGNLDAAQREFELALSLNPSYHLPNVNMGKLRAKRGDIAGAIDFYEKAVSSSPINATYLYDLGELYLEAGNPKKAAETFSRDAVLRPYSPKAWNELGYAYALMNKYEEALQAFGKAKALAPENTMVVENNARALFFSGRRKEGFKEVELLGRLNPALAESLIKEFGRQP